MHHEHSSSSDGPNSFGPRRSFLDFGDRPSRATTALLSAVRKPMAGGAVNGIGYHQQGSDVSVEAVVAPGYQFAGWEEMLPELLLKRLFTWTAIKV